MTAPMAGRLAPHGAWVLLVARLLRDDDEGISEVYALAREAFSGGQRGFQLQAYPFRMTAENLAKYRHDTNMPFWRNLKEGADHFEVTKREPKVSVCGGKYAFNTVSECADDPEIAPVVAQKRQEDNREVAELVAKGVPAVRLVYADGGGHESFRTTLASLSGASESGVFSILDARPRRNLGDVSRPDALAQGPREIAIDASGRPLPEGKAATQLASAEPATRRVAPLDAARDGGFCQELTSRPLPHGGSCSRALTPTLRFPPSRPSRPRSPSTSACSAACSRPTQPRPPHQRSRPRSRLRPPRPRPGRPPRRAPRPRCRRAGTRSRASRRRSPPSLPRCRFRLLVPSRPSRRRALRSRSATSKPAC
jgi:hypothetical protein